MAEKLPLGVAMGRIVGRLVGPSMPGHVGLPVTPSHEQLQSKIRQQLNDEMRSSLRDGWPCLVPLPESARRLPTPLSDIRPRPRARCRIDGELDHGLASNRELRTPHAGSCGSGGCDRLLLVCR